MSTLRRKVYTSCQAVRWGDMDYYGHVNNTVYFRYFEQIRVEFLESLNFPVSPGQTTGPVIISAECTFLRPVTYPASLLIEMYIGEPGRSSVMTWYTLKVEGDDTVYAEGSAKVVWMDMQTGRSTELPDKVRALAQ